MKVEKSRWKLLATLGIAASLLLASQEALGQADFYKGKTITIVHGGGPGGTADMRIRAVASFLGRYVPGNPTVIIDYMPGAGGRKAANHLYNKARPDGLTIANPGGGFVPSAVLGLPGVMYDVGNVTYLGSSLGGHPYAFFTRRQAGLGTLERLRATAGVRIGAHPVGHRQYPVIRAFVYVIGMKEPKIIPGYSSRGERNTALMRGEIDAMINNVPTIIEFDREWIEKGLVDIHALIEVPKGRKHPHPAFAQLPDLEALAGSDRDRKLVTTLRAMDVTGNPLILPPGTPKERAQILQEAMRKTFRDPEFHKEYRKLAGHDADPVMPEEMEAVIKELPRDPDVIELVKKLASADPLPPR